VASVCTDVRLTRPNTHAPATGLPLASVTVPLTVLATVVRGEGGEVVWTGPALAATAVVVVPTLRASASVVVVAVVLEWRRLELEVIATAPATVTVTASNATPAMSHGWRQTAPAVLTSSGLPSSTFASVERTTIGCRPDGRT
jgi:hypothetical protein